MDNMKANLIKTPTSYRLIVENFDYDYGHTWPEDWEHTHRLSLSNCQAIERGYDLDELAREMTDKEHQLATQYSKGYEKGIVVGFQKALELKADKKFSEFLDKEKELGISDIKTIERIQWYYNTYFDKSQQTEWDVEIVEEPADLAFYESGNRFPIDANLPDRFKYKPKLDADGCLILKRV